jgi:serine protease
VRFDREISPYSSRGDGLDIAAPGGDLRVDQNGDGMPDGVLQNTLLGRDPTRFDYLAWQGTSMAAPHVAGVAALVRASGVTDPDAIERALLSSAQPIGDRALYGAGLVRADAAIGRAVDGRGRARGAWALGLGLLVLGSLHRRRLLGLHHAGLVAGLAAVLAGGLAFVPWTSFGLGWLAEPLADGVGGLTSLGLVGVLALIAVPLGAGLALQQHAGLRPVLVALALASAAALFVEAIEPSAALVGGWLAGPALVLAASVLAVLGRQMARTDRPG